MLTAQVLTSVRLSLPIAAFDPAVRLAKLVEDVGPACMSAAEDFKDDALPPDGQRDRRTSLPHSLAGVPPADRCRRVQPAPRELYDGSDCIVTAGRISAGAVVVSALKEVLGPTDTKGASVVTKLDRPKLKIEQMSAVSRRCTKRRRASRSLRSWVNRARAPFRGGQP